MLSLIIVMHMPGMGYNHHEVGQEDRSSGACGDAEDLLMPGAEDLHVQLFFWNGSALGGRYGEGAGQGLGGVETKRKFSPIRYQKPPPKMSPTNVPKKCFEQNDHENLLMKNGSNETALATCRRVSGVGSCLPTDEPATAKHQSLCSSGDYHDHDGRKEKHTTNKNHVNNGERTTNVGKGITREGHPNERGDGKALEPNNKRKSQEFAREAKRRRPKARRM